MPLFITIGFFDILDVLLVAYLMYQLYRLIRGTVAIQIFGGIFTIYLLWLLVKAMKMSLLTTILGSFIGVGVLAVIIVFQQEIRRFLLLLGNQDIIRGQKFFNKYFGRHFQGNTTPTSHNTLREIARACNNMSKTKTGALIVFTTKSELSAYRQTGDAIEARVSHRLIESIFFKNSPMHDGAMIIVGDQLMAARCVLPIDDDLNLPPELGLRHRAALSMSNEADAMVITVSEETGSISIAKAGELTHRLTHEKLFATMQKEYLR